MERIAAERRRLRQVREALSAAVAQSANGDADFVPFYIAIGDYFEATMRRLHTQDIRMGDLLREKADLVLPANRRALDELEQRLSGNQEHLVNMLSARDALRERGADALAEFEAAAGAYADFIVANMGHHPGTTNLAQKLFSAEDWEAMAGVSDKCVAREQTLHEAVFAAQPAGLELSA